MEEIYNFGSKDFDQVEPLEKKILFAVRSVSIFLSKFLKCFSIGIWIILKSIVHSILPSSSKDIQNQVALVTGGARGIGRAISIELAKCGCNIAIADVDLPSAKDCCEELHLLGVKAFPYQCDVSSFDEVRTLKERIKVDLGIVDILVMSTSSMPNASLINGSPDEMMRAFKVNLMSQIWAIRVFLHEMIANKRGHIVSIDSLMGLDSDGRDVCYSAAKFGVRGLMNALIDLIRVDQLPINVTTIYPPLVHTKKQWFEQYTEERRQLEELTPYTTQDVAAATIDGILKNKKEIILPIFYLPVLKVLPLLPVDLQDLIRDNFKPRVECDLIKLKTK